jgi:hypothetical protein
VSSPQRLAGSTTKLLILCRRWARGEGLHSPTATPPVVVVVLASHIPINIRVFFFFSLNRYALVVVTGIKISLKRNPKTEKSIKY